MRKIRIAFAFCIWIFALCGKIHAQNIGINNTGNTPNASAMLDVSSTDKGLLIPRMTTAQRNTITSPALSLIIYNTDDNCFQAYNTILLQWENVHCFTSCVGPPSQPGSISGTAFFCSNNTGQTYSITAVSGATSYNWSVPAGATIVSGQGTTSITVDFTSASGNISVTADNACGSSPASSIYVAACSLAGWQYYKPVTISNTSGSPLTNYEVKLTVSFVSGKMNADFSDLRFVDGTCTQIDYWIETYTASTSATVWVQVPSIPTSGTEIYMYYGNTGATTTSNGPNTFLLFDDFEDGSINPALWVVTSGTASESAGAIRIGDGANSQDWVESIQIFNPGVAFYSQGNLANEVWTYTEYGFNAEPTFWRRWENNGLWTICNGVNGIAYSTPVNAVFNIEWLPNGNANFLVNGGLQVSSGPATSSRPVRLAQGSSGQTTSELLYVRNYVSPEPVPSFGSEVNCP